MTEISRSSAPVLDPGISTFTINELKPAVQLIWLTFQIMG